MTTPFIGEIRMFAGNFAPAGHAKCDGQLVAVTQNEALFSLVGTFYGGDGRTTFGLPDLRGRIPIHQGQGPGLPNYNIGAKAGSENATVNVGQLPSHTHPMPSTEQIADSASPAGKIPAQSTTMDLYIADAPSVDLASTSVTPTGAGQSHDNVMPYQCITFIIALFGVYPSRN